MQDAADGFRQYLVLTSHISDYDYPGERVYFLDWEVHNEKGEPFIMNGVWPYPGGVRPTLKQMKIIMDLVENEAEWDEITERSTKLRFEIDNPNRVMDRLIEQRLKENPVVEMKPLGRQDYKKKLYEVYGVKL